MPSTPNHGPGNDWPDAPETRPVPQDDDHSAETSAEQVGAPAGDAHAPGQNSPSQNSSGQNDEGATHRPPLPPGQVPAAWLPQNGNGGPSGGPGSPAAPPYDAAQTPPQPYPDQQYPAQPGAPSGPYPPQPGAPSGQYPAQPGASGGQYPPGAWFQQPAPHQQGPYPPPNAQWNLPERKRKTPDELKVIALRTRDRLRLFMIMVIGLLIVSQLALPFRLAGIALGLAAALVGVRVLIGLAEMHRSGMGARGLVFTLFGLGLTGMLLLVLVSQAVYYPVVSELEECQARANTESAAEACVDATNDRFNNILDDLNQRARNT
ncbi:hypothetical protein KIH74_03285 [Kineosporia sp. J2-2]|uniref:DUF4190 domain-containing protein n=1 Tax=Kineosporia corallincola TaxID=2835133 RepID=A0ABS5TA37_9ACTN|nr:hypothetical protein [Kineosporia corallincola]MBT0767930.1 hypothetical protein [Kineosporia corallincola]